MKIAAFQIRKLDKPLLLANLAMLVTVTFWGISFINIKVAVAEVPPITLALIRFAMASAVLLLISRKVEPASAIRKGDGKKMVLAGMVGVSLYFYLENTGVKLTTASNASLITSIIPVIAITMDIFIFKTKTSVVRLLAVGGALVGAYLAVTANGQISFGSDVFKGNMFEVGAMLSWVVYTLLNKTLTGKYSGLFLTTYQTLFGTLLLIPFSLLEYQQWHWFSAKALWNIVFLAICCSALCYFFYIYALKRLDVTITTLYLNLVPIVGVLAGYLILKETILPIQIVGGAIIIATIIMVNVENMLELARSSSRQDSPSELSCPEQQA